MEFKKEDYKEIWGNDNEYSLRIHFPPKKLTSWYKIKKFFRRIFGCHRIEDEMSIAFNRIHKLNQNMKSVADILNKISKEGEEIKHLLSKLSDRYD